MNQISSFNKANLETDVWRNSSMKYHDGESDDNFLSNKIWLVLGTDQIQTEPDKDDKSKQNKPITGQVQELKKKMVQPQMTKQTT